MATRVAAPPRFAAQNLLLAENDPSMAAMLSEILAFEGFEIRLAATGAELGERLACDGPFDLIVSDVAMPRMDGIEALHRARSLQVATPVLFISGLGDTDLEDRVAALGPAAALLRKPFNVPTLLAAVARMMR